MVDIKTLCTSQSTIEKMNIQVTDLQKIFANYISVKELIARIFFFKSYHSIIKINNWFHQKKKKFNIGYI